MKAGLVAIVLVAGVVTGWAEDFSVVALPDTQNYSESYPEIYLAQTQWCVDAAGEWNIRFVTHLGDLVQHAAYLDEWETARWAMDALDAGNMPYGTCVGNHDILYPGDYYDPDGINYLAHFGPQFYEGQAWYRGSSPSGLSNYQIIAFDGREYLFLHLLVETPAAELAWAQEVLNQHRDKPTMVSTHRYLYDWRILGQGRYGEFQYTFEPLYRHDGIKANDFFNNFIRPNKQIYMVICGHCDGQYRQVSSNLYGLSVHEILVDYQSSWDNGGDGYLRLMTFRPDENLIECRSYSPYQDDWNPGGDDTFNLTVDLDAYTTANPVLRFQDGVDGYYGTQDTWVGEKHPNDSHGGSNIVVIDDDTENSWFGDYVGQGLFRFDGLVQGPVYEGDPEPTAIPVGAIILNANMTLNLSDDTDAWDPDFYVHRMLRDWDEGSTWNSLQGGISPGDDCEAGYIALFHGDNDPDHDYHRTFSIKAAVQAWADGAANYGLAILPERDKDLIYLKGEDERFFDDGIDVRSSEDGDVPLRPSLDVEFTYDVLNTPPTVTQTLAVSEASVNEGREVELTLAAADPNPLDPLIFRVNGSDIGYATGEGTINHWVMMEDEGTYTFTAQVLDDEATVGAGSVQVEVANVAPEIVELTYDLTVDVDEAFTFAALATDPGVNDVLTYRWDFDADGAYDDFTGEAGTWSYSAAGTYVVALEVNDGDGGLAYGTFTVEVVADGLLGDMNCDGAVNFDDIAPFVLAIGGQAGYEAQWPDCAWLNGDVDGNGTVDFDDIADFIAILGG